MAKAKRSPGLARLFDLLDVLSTRHTHEHALPSNLSSAAYRGDLEMVELFLARGADVEEGTPLARAMTSGKAAVVARLLAAGAKPDSPDAARNAAMRGRTNLLEMLFDAGLDPASRPARRALETAIREGHDDSVQFLCDRGVLDENGLRPSPAVMAIKRHGTIREIDALFAQIGFAVSGGADQEQLEAEALSIVNSGKVDAEIDQTNDLGVSVLCAAILADSVPVIEALLARGADPTASATKNIPIARAASHGLASVVESLTPRAPQEHRDEALAEAAQVGRPEIVEGLLRSGADPSSRKGKGALAKASGPWRDDIRALIRRALRERGTKTTAALGVEGKNPRKSVAKLRGISEFVKPLLQSNPDWTFLALRKPIEEVTPRLASIYSAARAEIDVAARGVDLVTVGTFVFQFAGHAWTIELRSHGYHRRDRWKLERETVATISREIGCEAILCDGSDTAGTFGVSRYDRGERVEQVEWQFDECKVADAYFARLDLFMPGCRVDVQSIHPRLDLLRVDPSNVKRLDYLVLQE
jgi:ankyrin repeat protein